MIEPVIEALTTSNNPSRKAKIPMISSVALPKLALRMPLKAELVKFASSSVAWPIYLASGTDRYCSKQKNPKRG